MSIYIGVVWASMQAFSMSYFNFIIWSLLLYIFRPYLTLGFFFKSQLMEFVCKSVPWCCWYNAYYIIWTNFSFHIYENWPNESYKSDDVRVVSILNLPFHNTLEICICFWNKYSTNAVARVRTECMVQGILTILSQ